MSNEASLATTAWQNMMLTLANMYGCLWAQPPERETLHEREVNRLLDACEDESSQVKRFVASQKSRGWWVSGRSAPLLEMRFGHLRLLEILLSATHLHRDELRGSSALT